MLAYSMKELLSITFRKSYTELEASEPFKIVDLLKIDKTELEKLRRKVKRNKGKVEILVHPFYDENNPECAFPSTDEYKRVRNEFIDRAIEENVPLVIFEQDSDYNLLVDRIGNSAGTLYVVRTLDGEPTPKTEEHKQFLMGRARLNAEFRAWERVNRVLRAAGIKKANIGGRYMILKPSRDDEDHEDQFNRFTKAAKGKKNAKVWLDEKLYPDACPGIVVFKLLQQGIDVSLSYISSPTSKLEPTLSRG